MRYDGAMSRFALAVVIALAAPTQADARYFSGIDDLPLPPGFTELVVSAESFAGPGGRIVLAQAEGAAPGLAVRDFYYEALPQLGWGLSPQADGSLVFQRGRERLSFTVETADGRTRLGARLVVLPASMNAD